MKGCRGRQARSFSLWRDRLLIAVDNGSVPSAPTAAFRRLSAEHRLLLRCADNEPALRLPQAHQLKPRAYGLVRVWDRVWSPSRNALLKMESVATIRIRREGQCLHERTPLVVNRNSPGRPIVVTRQRSNQT